VDFSSEQLGSIGTMGLLCMQRPADAGSGTGILEAAINSPVRFAVIKLKPSHKKPGKQIGANMMLDYGIFYG